MAGMTGSSSRLVGAALVAVAALVRRDRALGCGLVMAGILAISLEKRGGA